MLVSESRWCWSRFSAWGDHGKWTRRWQEMPSTLTSSDDLRGDGDGWYLIVKRNAKMEGKIIEWRRLKRKLQEGRRGEIAEWEKPQMTAALTTSSRNKNYCPNKWRLTDKKEKIANKIDLGLNYRNINMLWEDELYYIFSANFPCKCH